jgi:hypothetical protein
MTPSLVVLILLKFENIPIIPCFFGGKILPIEDQKEGLSIVLEGFFQKKSPKFTIF